MSSAAINQVPCGECSEESVQLVCWKLWGGNFRTVTPVSIPGLRGVLYALPQDTDAGGDLYYLSACGSGAVARMCLADVVGHGGEVAKFSAGLEQVFGQQIHRENPSAVLREVNRRTITGNYDLMSTAVCLSYNSLNGTLRYANAGHPALRVWRKATGRWEPLRVESQSKVALVDIPLGVEAGAAYANATTQLHPGDRLLVFTDGLTEARDADGRLFGETIWSHGALRNTSVSAREQGEAIVEALSRHRANDEADDDISFALLEVLPYQASNRYSLLIKNNWRRFKAWMARGEGQETTG